jgi:hypothetical protein
MVEHIGTLREGPLHAALKEWYMEPGDVAEQPVDGLVVDLVRNDLLIEIQTGGFSPLKKKLDRLLPEHRVRIVHPVAIDTWIVRIGEGGELLSRRKSPKHAQVVDVFAGLVSITSHLGAAGLEIDVVCTTQEQVRRHEPGKAWRRKGWVIDQRSLVEVIDVHRIRRIDDLIALVPVEIRQGFTTADLSDSLGTSRRTAQQMAYCLRSVGLIRQAGTRDRAPVYQHIET